jgi:cyclopropane-fatty-acyl-phospholipid synthase
MLKKKPLINFLQGDFKVSIVETFQDKSKFPSSISNEVCIDEKVQKNSQTKFRSTIEHLASLADIRIGGNRSWDIQVHNEDLYPRLLAQGSLALGESYMDGWWDCENLDEFFYRIMRADLEDKVKPWKEVINVFKAKLFNLQKPSRAFRIGQHHYDIGNNLYEQMLDTHLIYSCGYWENAHTLDEAQEAKLDLVCRKLGLKRGMRVLDIGCGWGGAAKFAAERYDVEVVGITVSEEQAKLAEQTCRGLPVEIRLQDYRDLNEPFDNIYSLGMFEHVGHKNYGTYLNVVKRCLKNGGLFLMHTIGNSRSFSSPDPWIERYIFPNSILPSAKQICSAIEGQFVFEDWHNFGADYDTTLMHWFKRFQQSWDSLKKEYNERFYRMWKYYLLSCAGAFRARKIQLWQIVLSADGVPGGYRSIR